MPPGTERNRFPLPAGLLKQITLTAKFADEYHALFILMLVTGARPAELVPAKRSYHVALLKNEVNLDKTIILIRPAKVLPDKKGKTKDRTIKIPEELSEPLRSQIDSTPGLHVFPNIQNLFRIFNRILKKAEIDKLDALGKKLTAHSFRHTFATMVAEIVSGNQFVLKAILGHSQISTTDRYIHPSAPAVVIDIAGKIPAIRKIELLRMADTLLVTKKTGTVPKTGALPLG